MYATFGEFLRAKRLEKRITLRAFSQSLGYDPANYSRMERGLAPPPASEDRLRAMAERLGIAPNSEEYRELVRLAALGRVRSRDAFLRTRRSWPSCRCSSARSKETRWTTR